MYDLFFQHINKQVPLTAEEEEFIKPYLKLKKVRKKQYLLQEGEVCKTVCFVSKGALRQYYIEENGSEKIIQFALEGWTMGDLFSFFTGEPSQYNIDALEDSEVILIDRKAFDELTEKLRKFETYGRLMITRAYIALQKRLTSMISFTVEERYEQLLKQYPDIVQRVPQHMIASYMGLTPETLSRARKRAAAKK
jgi:CRP-like cAMP-binding protein